MRYVNRGVSANQGLFILWESPLSFWERVRVRAFLRRESLLLPEVSPSPRPSSSRERENEKALVSKPG